MLMPLSASLRPPAECNNNLTRGEAYSNCTSLTRTISNSWRYLAESSRRYCPPPCPIEVLGHHLVNNYIVMYRGTARFLPQPFCRGTDIGGEAAEKIRQLIPYPNEFLLGKGIAIIIVQRQQYLNEMHMPVPDSCS